MWWRIMTGVMVHIGFDPQSYVDIQLVGNDMSLNICLYYENINDWCHELDEITI